MSGAGQHLLCSAHWHFDSETAELAARAAAHGVRSSADSERHVADEHPRTAHIVSVGMAGVGDVEMWQMKVRSHVRNSHCESSLGQAGGEMR